MKAMIWSVLKLDHFNVLVIAKKKYLMMIFDKFVLKKTVIFHWVNIFKKIHKGSNTTEGHPRGFSNLKRTQRTPCL